MDHLLLYKALHHILNAEEKTIFDHWYAAASPEDRAYFHSAEENIRNRELTSIDINAAWERLIVKLQ